jgi:hypothetical protein
VSILGAKNMLERFGFSDSIKAIMTRKRSVVDLLNLGGYYPVVEHYRNGKIIGSYSFRNGITNEGKNFIFDVMFNGATQSGASSWFIGIINNVGYSAINATDTMAAHATWTEFTGYSQTTRVPWGQGAATGQIITNGTPATFDFNATGTLAGIFITNVGTKGGATGKLWSTGLFSSTVPVVSGDQLKNTYAISA